MGLGTALSVGASLASGIIGSKGNESAKDAQVTAAEKSAEAARAAGESAKQEIAPWAEAGTGAINKLRALLLDPNVNVSQMFEAESPGYQFRKAEGEKALYNRQSSGPGVYSGRAVKEAIRYGQDYASGEFDNYINRLMGLSAQGYNAAASRANITTGTGNAIAGANVLAGQARADAATGKAASWNNAIQGGISNVIAQQQHDDWMKRIPEIQT